MNIPKFYSSFKNTIFSALLLVGSVFMFYKSFYVKALSKTADNLGPGFMPKLVFSVMILLSAIILIKSLKKELPAFSALRKNTDKTKSEESGFVNTRIAAACAGLVWLMVFMNKLGFILTSFVYLFFELVFLSPKEKRRIPLFAIISIVFVLLCYWLFKYRMYIALPAGILG